MITVAAIAAMLLFASIVVDVGYVMLLRRSDQAAADTAVLAAVADRYDEAAFAATVIDVFNANVTDGGAFTLAELNTCSMALPAGWSSYPSYNCLAHDASYGEIRVQVPPREYQATLGRLGGVNTISHTAFAQAGAGTSSDVLPFAIPANAENYECLKDGSKAPECTGSTQGNFGNVDFYTFGSGAEGTTKKCNGPKQTYPINIAQGLDHGLSLWNGGTSVWEQNTCNSGNGAPNGANSSTGNTPNLLGDGLWGNDTYPDGGPARLLRTSSMPPAQSTTIDSAVIDDTPIWAYIKPSLSNSDDVPRSCWRDQFVGDFDDTQPWSSSNNMDKGGMDWPDDDAIMSKLPTDVEAYLISDSREDRMIKLVQRCFDHYQGLAWTDGGTFSGVDPYSNGCSGACDDPVFSRDSDSDDSLFDIQDSPRFAYVPQLPVGETLGKNKDVHFAAFRAVYLHRLYLNNNANQIYNPGLASAGVPGGYSGGRGNIWGMTAFVFPPGILPAGLGDDDAATALGSNLFLELTR